MRKLLGFLVLSIVFATAWMYSVATRDPIVRSTNIAMPDWPRGARPIRVALLTDIHVAGPDMPPQRVKRIVDRVNALRPDLILLGGDFVSDKRLATRRYSAEEAIRPLARLQAPLGVIAVLGNHDIWRGQSEIVDALQRSDVRVLDNTAIEVGPLSLGGAGDAFTGHDQVNRTVIGMRRFSGAKVMLSHSPDVAPELPTDITLLLAGHTHCGQIRLPLIGAVAYMSKYGDRYACGLMRDNSLRVITSAGIGTSLLPLRLGAVPDFWLVTLGPRGRS